MKKRFLRAACVLICGLLLAGCSQSGEKTSASGDLLSQIKERGELVVAMEGMWSPWTYHDESGELVGYDVEVSQKIAEKLGVKVSFVEGDFDSCLAGLDAGRYDMVVNGVTIRPDREEKYDFSTPYAYDHMAVIVKNDDDRIQKLEDLEGKTTANTISSVYAEVAKQYGAEVTGVDDLNQTFELLFSGRIDATLNSEMTYYDYMRAHPDAEIRIAAMMDNPDEIAIPMLKGENTASLREAVDQALKELSDSGELSTLSEKYFGSDISQAN